MAAVLLGLMVLIGTVSVAKLAAVDARGGSMYADRVVPVRDLAEARAQLGDIDSQIQRAITHGSDQAYADVADADAKRIDALIKGYEATLLVPAETAGLRRFHAAWTAYRTSFQAVLADTAAGDDDAAVREDIATAAGRYAELDGTLKRLVAVNDRVAKALNEEIRSTYEGARTLVIAVLGVALLAGVALARLLSRRLVGGIRSMPGAARGIAEGDVDQAIDVRSKDELGEMAEAFEAMIADNREMAAHASRIAGGDLTGDVAPKSDRDALGQAFSTMAANLRRLVLDVSDSAAHLSSASEEMSATSEEAGRAVTEIADVAQGAERQVRLVETTRQAVREAAVAASAGVEGARTTAEAAQDARRAAQQGVQAAEQASAVMLEVAASSEQVGGAIGKLCERSQEIGGMRPPSGSPPRPPAPRRAWPRSRTSPSPRRPRRSRSRPDGADVRVGAGDRRLRLRAGLDRRAARRAGRALPRDGLSPPASPGR
jgi:methyl-accepting chemotaxis protein